MKTDICTVRKIKIRTMAISSVLMVVEYRGLHQSHLFKNIDMSGTNFFFLGGCLLSKLKSNSENFNTNPNFLPGHSIKNTSF